MTIFVAALFLPYTINFEVNKPKTPPKGLPRHPSQIRVGDYNSSPTVSLFTPDSNSPESGASSTVHEQQADLFTHERKSSSASSEMLLQKRAQSWPSPAIQVLAPAEPHSPAWGRQGVFNQPKSRAASPPPASILNHSREIERKVHSRGPSMADPREDSQDRALRDADWSVQPAEQGNAGLRNAVHAAYLADGDLEKIWIGTLGMPTDALDQDRKDDIASMLQTDYDCMTVFLEDSDLDGHYSHYCKTILWPMLHYQVPDSPKSKAYEDHSWVYYVKINQAFADHIVKGYKRGDIIWINDYHLLLVPAMIRKILPDAQIGLFLHVSFPSSEVFRCLSVRNQILEGMLGANLIGFQAQEYCLHFLQTCSRLLFTEATPTGVQLEDRFVNVSSFPIGIVPQVLNERRGDHVVQEWVRKIQQKFSNKYLIVARDKLDHVRGVRQKLLAYELFLNKYPQFADHTVLIQVATSATNQAELDCVVSEIVTRINSQHSTLAHQPLMYLKQDMGYKQYLAMLMSADALMITSLREGMNLTSHEYICCQDGRYGRKSHGVLILSEFTGSSSIFDGNDLSVNPWDHRQCAEAMRKALQMSPEEKEERWCKLIDLVKLTDGARWFNSFLKELDRAWDQQARRHTFSIPRLSTTKLCEQYRASETRLFMLDYEGTLASHETRTSYQFTSPQRTIDALTALASTKGNIMYVMSGKRPEELHILFERVPGLGIIAENGCFLRFHDSDEWIEAPDLDQIQGWKECLRHIIQYYSDRLEGSYIEDRHCSMVLVTKECDDQVAAARAAGECASHINDACQCLKIHAVPIEGGLVAESTLWSKGTAATKIFEYIKKQCSAKGIEHPSFLMVAGDSRDDEVIYHWANKLGEDNIVRDVTTVSVSSRNTEAQTTLTQGITGILSSLYKLAAIQ